MSDHSEARCQLCGGRNISWHVDSTLWNEAVRAKGLPELLCPVCFAMAYDDEPPNDVFGGAHWELRLDIPPKTKTSARWPCKQQRSSWEGVPAEVLCSHPTCSPTGEYA